MTDERASVYVHIPFCETKCPYCDFNSFAVEGRDVDGYFSALRREMDARDLPRDPPTLYVGGGTPTVVAESTLAAYLDDLCARFDPDPAREFTVEANPGSLTPEKVAILRDHRVTRVSLGAQSLVDRHLRTLGRVHSARDVEEAYAWIRDGEIPEASVDLIHAVPGLTRREWAWTLSTVLSWRPDHLSCYALTFEPKTPFFAARRAGRMQSVPEEDELAMFRLTERLCRGAGLARYEISNFAQRGFECRHNLRYWHNEAYVGIGAGAVSYLDGERRANERSLSRYAESVQRKGDATVWRERLTGERGAREMVVLGLRTARGADLEEAGRRFGVDVRSVLADPVRRLVHQGLVSLENGRHLRLERRGWRLADTVAVELL